MNETDFLVIGAGLAGLAFAGDASGTVRVLDKGRGVGGRMATRRWGTLRVDHGAQFFTARGERFEKIVAAMAADGDARVWSHGFPAWSAQTGIVPRPDSYPRFCCPDGMSALPKRLAAALPADRVTIETGQAVTSVVRTGDTYTATLADGTTRSGRRLVLNLPPAQALTIAGALFSAETGETLRAADAAFDPAWTLVLRLDRDVANADWPALDLGSDTATSSGAVCGHPVLGWLSRDHTKRAAGAPPVLVAHGSGRWSRAHREDDPGTVAAALTAAVTEVAGPLAIADTMPPHRWRYAAPTNKPFTDGCLVVADTLGLCGDWCVGGRVEGALASGWSLAERLC